MDTDGAASRRCDICQHHITNTAMHNDAGMLTLMAENPDACLKVDLYQDNLSIIYQDAKL